MNNHLTDDEIQSYVLNNNTNNINIQQHIKICEACKASAANYSILFKSIKEEPKPLFEFDVVNIVMPALPKPRQSAVKVDFFMYAVLFTAIGLLCIPVYLYKKDLGRVFENMAPVIIALIILPVVAILCLQFYEIYKVYKKQMAAIK